MDKNQVTGLILISGLLLVYFYFFAPKPKEQPATEEPVEMIQPEQETVVEQNQVSQEPALQQADLQSEKIDTLETQPAGPFAGILTGEEEEITVENDVALFTFSTLGGGFTSVELKEFKTADKNPLVLLDKNTSFISEIVQTQYGSLDINKVFYQADINNTKVSGKDTLQIRFISKSEDGKSVIKDYKIPGNSYTITQSISLQGIRNELAGDRIAFTWQNNMKKIEKDLKTSQMKTTIKWYTPDGDSDDLKESSSDPEEATLSQPISWIAFKQKFFTSAIIGGQQPLLGAIIATDPVNIDTSTVKSGIIKTNIRLVEDETLNRYYFGPNNYQVLKKVTPGFAKNIYLGWPPVNMVNKFLIIPIFNFLDSYISNYGIIIILLVIIIKIILFPLTYKSYISMAKTKVLKPELDAIKEKHGGDMQKAQADQMQLYRQVGVNPISGCIPLLLQMPILFSMFYFFPNSIELRQQSFLWANDLSTYDSVLSLPFTIPAYGDHVSLFTILMTLSTILYTWSNNQVTTVQGPMKSMQYMMPVVFMFVLNSFPAALSFYYFVANLVTFGQQALIRKFVDEDKIKRILDENRKKNVSKKKSKFQLRLEEAMKAKEEGMQKAPRKTAQRTMPKKKKRR
jgi:YidC/Oxa1 family membrane protein insertase